jgi:hypothetical protein
MGDSSAQPTSRFAQWISNAAGISWQSFKEILLFFVLSRALVFLINAAVFVSANLDPFSPGVRLRDGMSFSDVPLLMWQRWDSNHYIAIATNGYSVTVNGAMNTAYFPLYPLLGSLVGWVVPNMTISLLVVSNLAFFFALLFLYKLVLLDDDTGAGSRAVQYACFYPFTLFFSGVFTESVFLLLLLTAFYYARTGRWLNAGIAGMFASSTRLLGSAVFPALAWEYAQQRSWKVRSIDRSVAALALVPVGLLLYFCYTYVAFGDFLSTFHSTRKGWGGEPAWPWVSFEGNISRLVNDFSKLIPFLELLFAVVAVGMVVASFRYLRTSYAILAAMLVLISFSNISLQSFCRYLVTMFPLYLLMARAGRRTPVHTAIMVVSAAGLVFFTALFGNGKFIG